MARTHILLLYGGQSSEHEVSVASASNVFAALDNTKFDISTCLIDKAGRWWLTEAVGDYHVGSPQLLPVLGQKRFVTLPDHRIIQPDVIFPVLHGRNGEDGTVQGLVELLGIPLVGPNLLAAAVTMDKDMTKRLLEAANIPVVPWYTWLVHDHKPTYATIRASLGPDVFVKPASAGSSVGVSHVTSEEEWEPILDKAADHSDMVLIEKTVQSAREIEVAVIGNRSLMVSTPGEIIPGEDFYTYEDKYSNESKSQAVIPATLEDDVKAKIQHYAELAYKVAECRGMARVDFLLENDRTIYLNEINSIPGFTSISMYPKLLRRDGLSYPQLVERLIELALE